MGLPAASPSGLSLPRLPGAGSMRLNGSTMNQYRNPHEREAARLRLLLANTTTPRVKARLSEEVEKLDQLAEGLGVPAVP